LAGEEILLGAAFRGLRGQYQVIPLGAVNEFLAAILIREKEVFRDRDTPSTSRNGSCGLPALRTSVCLSCLYAYLPRNARGIESVYNLETICLQFSS
jgi:hypothetical protein